MPLDTLTGVNFSGKNVCGNFFFAGTYFCGSLKKLQNLEREKFRATRYLLFILTLFCEQLIAVFVENN